MNAAVAHCVARSVCEQRAAEHRTEAAARLADAYTQCQNSIQASARLGNTRTRCGDMEPSGVDALRRDGFRVVYREAVEYIAGPGEGLPACHDVYWGDATA